MVSAAVSTRAGTFRGLQTGTSPAVEFTTTPAPRPGRLTETVRRLAATLHPTVKAVFGRGPLAVTTTGDRLGASPHAEAAALVGEDFTAAAEAPTAVVVDGGKGNLGGSCISRDSEMEKDICD